MKKLYEVKIGADVVKETTMPDGTVSRTTEHVERADMKNVVASDVVDAISKIELTEGQHIESVVKLNDIDAD